MSKCITVNVLSIKKSMLVHSLQVYINNTTQQNCIQLINESNLLLYNYFILLKSQKNCKPPTTITISGVKNYISQHNLIPYI